MERIENIEAGERREGAEVVRLWPINVLVVSPDHCYRSTVSMLIGRRDRPALTAAGEQQAIELAARERIDVVVLERPAAEARKSWETHVQSLAASIGLAMARQ